ncbi:MAG: ABC transporter ATP-binding protein [Thermodesulfobacteriota bacterium]
MVMLAKFQEYLAGRKWLLSGALILSALSSIMGMLPYICIWLIVREFLTVNTSSSPESLTAYAWWALGSATSSILLYYCSLSLSHLAAFRVECNMRSQAMKKIITFPLGFFDNNTSGRIRKIIDENSSVTHSFLAHQLPDLAGTIFMPLVTTVLLFVFDWRLGLAYLVPIVASIGIMSFMMGKQGREFMKSYMNALEDMNTEAVEYVRGIPVVKVFQQTVYSFKKFYKSIVNYKTMVTQYTSLWKNPMSTYIVLIHSFSYFLVPITIILIGNKNQYSGILLDLLFYILISPVFAQSIMRSMYINQAMGQAYEAVDRIKELTDVEPLPAASKPKPITSHDITFEDVSFTYPGSDRKAISGIRFTIPEGKTYALVGPSGSGKTTIARLVPRFWDVDIGRVSIGGIDVKDIAPDELMRHVSFVFQNTKLFKTTVLDNIRYGNPTATEENVEQAIKLAHCRDILDKLPDGLHTRLGAGGTYLSGGEQQRIALARAILKNAPIVVLDEATAFSDPENEHLIQQALRKLTQGKTILMIAHRLTSVADVDRIIVLRNGLISEQGTHNELLNSQGLYADMWHGFQQSIQWTIGKEMHHA